MYKYDIKTIHLGISAVIYKYDMICDICDVCDMSLRIPWSGKKHNFHALSSRKLALEELSSASSHPNLKVVGGLSLEHHLRQFLHQPIEKGAQFVER